MTNYAVRASSPPMVERRTDLNLLAVLLLMSSHHFVLVSLRLTNPLWCDVAELLGHFLELQLADGCGNKMIRMVVKRRSVVERDMTQANRC